MFNFIWFELENLQQGMGKIEANLFLFRESWRPSNF
jgi:hypothetical protein